MNGKRTIQLGVLFAGMPLAIITLLSFVLLGSGGGHRLPHVWVSGMAAASAEIMVVLYIFKTLNLRNGNSAPVPFRIATATVIGIYAITAGAEIVLFGYLMKITFTAYLVMQLATFLIAVCILGLIALAGKYAGAHESKESALLADRKETLSWVSSLRHTYPMNDRLDRLILELEEGIRYSDPITHSSLSAVEDLIRQKISLLEDQLRLAAAAGEKEKDALAEEAVSIVLDIQETLMERNMQLKHLKAGGN
ncbi:hypothetical protein [Paenibacillus sp. DMB20]|uniref:hypothetical protein n=1 Tax=Paenibacillus sp. DMB20 TaxID=1642570 RepID=UPI000628182F|nr:hypothetical protein [Paenibacillus sp. DMB20]KKO51866.1 hypothetical protein XI25_23390 [Paenibacillus sp. DMB20]